MSTRQPPDNDDRTLLAIGGVTAACLALSIYFKNRRQALIRAEASPGIAPGFAASGKQLVPGLATRTGLRAFAHDIGGDTRAMKLPPAMRAELPWFQASPSIAFLTGEAPRSWAVDYIVAETSRARSLLDADFRLAANAHRPRLAPLSTYRSFEDQADIVAGFLKQLTPAVNPEDAGSIRSGLVQCLTTRMIPGFSRHHWGSEVDVLSNDQRSWQEGGANQEYIAPLTLLAPARGLYYPYREDGFPLPNRPHLEPEPWHFSLAHVSVPLQQQWLRQIGDQPAALSALLDRVANAIATRAKLNVARTRAALGMIDLVSYVRNVAPAPRMAFEAVV